MENFTPDFEIMLKKKLGFYRRLNVLLNKERQSILHIDVDSLWKTAEKKRKTVENIQELKEKILAHLGRRFNLNGMDINTFSLSYLIRIIPVKSQIKSRLRELKLSIEKEKDQLARAAKENQRFVKEYLGVIDDIMSVVVDNSGQAQYNLTGTVPREKKTRHLIHARV